MLVNSLICSDRQNNCFRLKCHPGLNLVPNRQGYLPNATLTMPSAHTTTEQNTEMNIKAQGNSAVLLTVYRSSKMPFDFVTTFRLTFCSRNLRLWMSPVHRPTAATQVGWRL